jgi:hypothetical protein
VLFARVMTVYKLCVQQKFVGSIKRHFNPYKVCFLMGPTIFC